MVGIVNWRVNQWAHWIGKNGNWLVLLLCVNCLCAAKRLNASCATNENCAEIAAVKWISFVAVRECQSSFPTTCHCCFWTVGLGRVVVCCNYQHKWTHVIAVFVFIVVNFGRVWTGFIFNQLYPLASIEWIILKCRCEAFQFFPFFIFFFDGVV